MKRFLFFVLSIALFLCGLYVWTQHRREVLNVPAYTPTSAPVVDAKDVHLLSAIDQEYTSVVDAVLPSVVSITTSKQVQTGYILDPMEFLQNHRLLPKLENRAVLGSGVIVSKEGHILTNYHVVADTNKIQVELSDGRAEPAEIIGTDPETDIAVLKIKADNLRPLPMGNSDEVKVGQLVFAVGNPLGLQETVTRGIISAKSRVVDDSSLEYFQTDAAINEGNSGGPLVNLRGEVIGINTRVASQTGNVQPQGLSFAIPANVARRTLEAIIKNGRVVHSYLGVEFKQLPPEIASQEGGGHANGVLVNAILAGSPAEKAGLRNGDVITKYNGREIAGIHDLHNRVAETPVNSNITLDVIHPNGQAATLTALITAQPVDFNTPQTPVAPVAPQETGPAVNILDGVKVSEIPADRRATIPDVVKGVLVVQIDSGSFMGKLPGSLKAGDVIEEIDHLPVASLADFEQVTRQLPPGAKQMLFLIYRNGANSYVVITRR